MNIYDYYYDDDYIYYICNVSLFKMQLLEHVVNRKRQQKTNKQDKNKEQQQQGNFIQYCNRKRFLCFYRYFIYFLQRLYKKTNGKRFYNYYYYTLYL